MRAGSLRVSNHATVTCPSLLTAIEGMTWSAALPSVLRVTGLLQLLPPLFERLYMMSLPAPALRPSAQATYMLPNPSTPAAGYIPARYAAARGCSAVALATVLRL